MADDLFPHDDLRAEALEAREDTTHKVPNNLDGALCVILCDHFLKGSLDKAAALLDDGGTDQVTGSAQWHKNSLTVMAIKIKIHAPAKAIDAE